MESKVEAVNSNGQPIDLTYVTLPMKSRINLYNRPV